MTTDTTHPRPLLLGIAYHEGIAVATFQTGVDTFRALYNAGDDWQWTAMCATPERARLSVLLALCGRQLTSESEGVAA